VRRDPRPPRSLGRELALQLVIVQDLVPFKIEREHLSWPEATLFDNPVVVELDRPDLRASDDQALGGDVVAARPQAVAVECGANVATVRKSEAGGPVPGLDDRGVVAVEVLHRR